MPKITLSNLTSSYSSISKMNDLFDKIENALNNDVLYRNPPPGEPNQMEADLDMNSNRILNPFTDVTNPNSLITVGKADDRYLNESGDTLEGPLDFNFKDLSGVQDASSPYEPINKRQLDKESKARTAADKNLQSQITSSIDITALAFSEISWHDTVIENSVQIPDDQNAWSIGPTITVADGQEVEVGNGSVWSIID